MPMCGFNQEMIEGLDSFHKGLVETLLEKPPADKIEEESLLEEN